MKYSVVVWGSVGLVRGNMGYSVLSVFSGGGECIRRKGERGGGQCV